MIIRWLMVLPVILLAAVSRAVPLTTAQIAEKALPACVSLEVTTDEGVVTGSGVVIEETGVILTCYHVIAGANTATATMHNGGQFPVQGVLAASPTQDLALL